MEMQAALTGVSLAGATFSTVTTVYYWFARARNERPRLICELVDREFFLGAQTAEKRQLGLKLGLVVANGSSLPNAVLAVKVWIRQREGGWMEVEKLTFDKSTPRPINVPAMQTAFLTVNGMLTFLFVNELEQGGNKILSAYADRFLSNPREIKVELKGLNDKRFTCVVSTELPS